MSISINPDTTSVNITAASNTITVVDTANSVNVSTSQPITSVVTVAIPGPQGPAGSGTTIDTGSFATRSSLQELIDVTGSFTTTGSNSFIGNQVITGSLTVSGSSTFTNIGPAVFSGSVGSTQGFTGSLQGTASYALNAGVTIDTGSFATTGSNTFIGNQTISGSLTVSGSIRGGGIVTSSNVSTIQTITSASYAGLTPVSGTLYIIIG